MPAEAGGASGPWGRLRYRRPLDPVPALTAEERWHQTLALRPGVAWQEAQRMPGSAAGYLWPPKPNPNSKQPRGLQLYQDSSHCEESYNRAQK